MVALNDCIDEVSWEQVRKEVSQLNPLLAKWIDDFIEPGSELTLFRVKYPFGAPIFQRNQVQFPLNRQQFVPITDKNLPEKIRNQLSYSPMPLAFLMNKKVEIFSENTENLLPLNLINPGQLIGLYEFFNRPEKMLPRFPSLITAGLRSVFFLPRIADGQSHRKLKMIYHIKHAAPKKLMEHWHVFREVLQSPYIECDWTCELLFVSHAFVKAIRQQTNYLALKNYLMKMLWQQTEIWQNRAYSEINWQILSRAMILDNFKIMPNDILIIRKLLDIANGLIAGFRPAIDEIGLPLHTLQTIYLNDYGLKDYAPIIMQPDYLTQPSSLEQPIYFSLLFPTSFCHKTTNRQQSTRNELREVIQLNEAINYFLLKHNYFYFPKLNRLCYEYFHSDADALHKIHPTSTILQFDESLAKQVSLYGNRKFPEKSSFLRGAVLILRK